jgi:radical SAM superfamily enzyme YgiQ (UPF0313 family)
MSFWFTVYLHFLVGIAKPPLIGANAALSGPRLHYRDRCRTQNCWHKKLVVQIVTVEGDNLLLCTGSDMTSSPRQLLIAPTALDMHGRPVKQKHLHLPGLTLLMLAAVTPPHYFTRLLYETVEDIPFDEQWDIVGITGMGSGIVRAWQIADEFRARGATVVIGGIAASLGRPEYSLEHADVLVIGEAEDIWPEILNDFERGRLQRSYQAKTPPDIATLPAPRYDLLNRPRIGFWRPVQATRGCPLPCTFCSVTAFHRAAYRKRPVEQIIRDVRLARKSGSRHITFIDDNIGVDWDYCRELWEALIPEKITWMSQCSLHIADHPDMLALAYRSGCRLLSIGIESLSRKNLLEVRKHWNHPEKYVRSVERIRRHGIDVSTEMIIGMDSDDADVFEQTFRFISEARISVPRIHILTPVPGTPLYESFDRDKRLIHRDFGRYSGGQVVFTPALISAEDLQRGYWDLYEKLFSWREILRRTWRNPARLGILMRGIVWSTNLHYRNHVKRRITPGIV